MSKNGNPFCSKLLHFAYRCQCKCKAKCSNYYILQRYYILGCDIGPLYPLVCIKGDWNGADSRNNRKKGGLCRCLDGHVKEHYEIPMARKPDPWSNFLSPPAHLCAIPCIAEISLNVTLSNQSKHSFMRGLIRIITK